MKRSLILAGLSLFLLSACGTASDVTDEGAVQSSSSVSSVSSSEAVSSMSSSDNTPEVEVNVDTDGTVEVK